MERRLKCLYNDYWSSKPLGSGYDGYKRAADCLGTTLEFNSVLDIGTGNGAAVEVFKKAGKIVKGIEYSHWLYEHLLKDKFPDSEITEGDVANLLFADRSFDLIFCSDVLEHLPEWKVGKAISEIYRVCGKYFYGTIADDLDEEGRYHLTIRPQGWWQGIFKWAGFNLLECKGKVHIYEKC